MDSASLSMTEVVPAKEKKGISGSTIKIIAIAAMLIDHAGAVVVGRILLSKAGGGEDIATAMDWMFNNAGGFLIYFVMRLIGRLGFPIFCFLLAEGFQRTRDVKKYALRLGVFALISEVPFDLAIRGKALDFSYQNVYFTLLLGLFALIAFDFLERRGRQTQTEGRSLPKALWTIFGFTGVLFPVFYITIIVSSQFFVGDNTALPLLIVFVAMCILAVILLTVYKKKKGAESARIVCADLTVLLLLMLLADFMCTDYGGMGVLTIAVMYIFRKKKVISMLAGCITLTIMSIIECTGFAALIPIALYNGKRGLKLKYFFYAFYPLHLLLLYLIAMCMGLGSLPSL